MKIVIYGVENTSIRLQVEKELSNVSEVVGYIVEGGGKQQEIINICMNINVGYPCSR